MIAQLRAVTRTFGDVVAVDAVDLDVEPGEIVGLVGANGAGKTTALRILLGLLEPTAGTARLFGVEPNRDSVRRIGYVPQGLGLYVDLTPAENMAFQAGVFGFEPAAPPADLQTWWHVPVERLPLGIRRRVAFEISLAHRPELLVLDEPTSGVGPLGRVRLWEMLHSVAEDGAGVIVTTHYLEEAEQCDRLVMMASGRVVATGTIDQVVGGRTATLIEVGQPRPVVERLEELGARVGVTSAGLRTADLDRETVERILGESGVSARVRTVPATLDETYVALSR
ncbi:MAG: ABC transporter ATP-binding protein [Acidimicrobiia bacterium]|nr:ABC transporter ATP-binding protein [Acidimicrobiia bacterium]